MRVDQLAGWLCTGPSFLGEQLAATSDQFTTTKKKFHKTCLSQKGFRV